MTESLSNHLSNLSKSYPELKMEFKLQEWETDFLRFYQSQINYNVSKQSISLSTTVHKGKKSYSFGITNPSKEMISEKIEEAIEFIDKLPEDPDFVDIEDDLTKTSENDKDNNINKVSLDRKIEILKRISDKVEQFGFKIYGTFICNYSTLYIINSNGLLKREISSPIMLEMKAVSQKNEVTVLESFGSEDFTFFNEEIFTNNLLNKVKAARNEIIDVDPGEYEVVLAPRCIGEFLQYLSYGMSARSVDTKESYFEDKVNEKVFSDKITILDDPHSEGMMNFDYNGDGHIYQKTALIENGVFKNFLVDNYYGRKLGMKKNGASATALRMEPGEKTLDEMIGSIKNGLYISSLHYMNFINKKETSVTGLTRDGTFLIENGKLTKVVNNLRFTEKITDVLKGIVDIENKTFTIPFSDNYGEFGIESVNMPHVKVNGFKISSSTKTI